MVPGLDNLIHLSSWTLGSFNLVLSQQLVVGCEFFLSNSQFQKLLDSVNLHLSWCLACEFPDKSDTDALSVVTLGMSSFGIPAPTLVDVTIAAYQKVVADVVPTELLYVEILDIKKLSDALVFG